MKLQPLTLRQCLEVAKWRNESLETLRTPYPLTEEMQEEFYRNVICNRNSPHRFWAIMNPESDKEHQIFTGMGGLTDISIENRNAEISLIINPFCRGKGIGEKAVDLILDQGFNYLNLETICGEVYACNNAVNFWNNIVEKYRTKTTLGNWVMLTSRKFWKGKYYPSFYFSIDREDFNMLKNGSEKKPN